MKNRETTGLVAAATLAALAISSGTALAYTVNGQVRCTPTSWVPRGTVVQAFEVDPLPGGAYAVNTPALASGTVSDAGAFSLTFAWPTPGPGFEAGGPDLVFRLTQNVGGSSVTIYEEKPAKAHWNLADGSSTTLETDSPQAVCSNPAISTADIPNNKFFLFTRVGRYPTAEIDCKASVATSAGYVHPRKAPFGYTGIDTDMPFGATLDLFGWVGKKASIAYYKVQYSSDGWGTVSEVETPLPNYWYDTSSPNPLAWHWVAESMGPFTDGGQVNLYKVPFLVRPDTPWSWLDRIAQFDTVRAANGKVRVRIVPYVWNAAHTALVVASSGDLAIDTNYGEIALQVDNTPPSVQILSVNGSAAACNVVHFGTAATDRITVGFRVFDQRGHLREYTLEAMYGHSQWVSPRPTAPNQAHDDYAHNAAASPAWQGSTDYTTNYVGNVQTPAVMPSCAYQLRLGVSKRTTNGYGLVYPWVEDTWHASIQRP